MQLNMSYPAEMSELATIHFQSTEKKPLCWIIVSLLPNSVFLYVTGKINLIWASVGMVMGRSWKKFHFWLNCAFTAWIELRRKRGDKGEWDNDQTRERETDGEERTRSERKRERENWLTRITTLLSWQKNCTIFSWYELWWLFFVSLSPLSLPLSLWVPASFLTPPAWPPILPHPTKTAPRCSAQPPFQSGSTASWLTHWPLWDKGNLNHERPTEHTGPQSIPSHGSLYMCACRTITCHLFRCLA